MAMPFIEGDAREAIVVPLGSRDRFVHAGLIHFDFHDVVGRFVFDKIPCGLGLGMERCLAAGARFTTLAICFAKSSSARVG